MTLTAADHVNRIVQLVATLSRDPTVAEEGVALGDLAARLGSSTEQVRADLRTLTAISDDAGAEWLQSLSVWQEGDRVAAVSQGPFRRPLRFTPEELLAIRVGLALEGPAGERLARALTEAVEADHGPVAVGLDGGAAPAAADLAREAMDRRRVLTILYAGERDRAGTARAIEPHQIVAAFGQTYVVAWYRRAEDWRHFRADRVLDAALESEAFTPRTGFAPVEDPAALFRGEDEADAVVVCFGPAVARWLAERFPDARAVADGAVEVTYRVAEPAWLVRAVLQYGADAEVVGPPAYRAAVARALARSGA